MYYSNKGYFKESNESANGLKVSNSYRPLLTYVALVPYM